VPVSEITQGQFAALTAGDHCRQLWPAEQEREWFASSDGKLIGVLLEKPADGSWGYSICRLADNGQYHRIALGADIPTADLARNDLVANMRRLPRA
jgi:hypothetical protein